MKNDKNKLYKEFYNHIRDVESQLRIATKDYVKNKYQIQWINALNYALTDVCYNERYISGLNSNILHGYNNQYIIKLKEYFSNHMNCNDCHNKVQCALKSNGRKDIVMTRYIKYKKFYTIIKQCNLLSFYDICCMCQDKNYRTTWTVMLYDIKPKTNVVITQSSNHLQKA